MIVWWCRKTVEDLTIEETLKLMSKEICAKLEIEPKNLDRRKEVETFSDIAVTILEKNVDFVKIRFMSSGMTNIQDTNVETQFIQSTI